MKARMLEKVFYKKGEILTFEQAKEKALLFLGYIRMTNEDLMDYWFGIADNWDLNIWLEMDSEYREEDEAKYLRATLYPVKDGFMQSGYTRIYPLTD